MPLKIKPENINIPIENPFVNCKLNRSQYAEILTPIISLDNKGFVLAIDNPWGSGKSTFIKMWRQSLEHEGFKCIYFNAWENDFDQNSLSAILSELQTIIKSKADFKSLIKKGGVLAKNIIPGIVESIASKYIGTKELSELIKEISKAGTEILVEEINDYSKKKKGINEFKIELEKCLKNNSDKPLIFFIDELDRCNPHYAIDVLEKVKHFFSVEGIVFVLSIDKKQLSNSIKGYFGSEDTDSVEYLRRFIDIEFSLPEPNTLDYCNYLYDYYGFANFFENTERGKYPALRDEKNEFLKFTSKLFESKKVKLRHQEKIFSHSRIVLLSLRSNSYLFPSFFVLIIYLRLFEKDIYNLIIKKGSDIQELINKLEGLIDVNNSEQGFLKLYTYAIAKVIALYNQSDKRYPDDYFFSRNSESEFLKLNSTIPISNTFDGLGRMLYSVIKEHSSEIGIDYFIRRIELIEKISD